jgi:two-component system, NarL family, nitrate/nitrite response regulator NarL
VAVCGGVRLYRDGVAEVLGQRPEVRVVAVYADAEEAMAHLSSVDPDVVLVDGTAPDSLATIQAIVRAAPEARTVTIALPENEETVLAHAEAGASGYVGRESSVEELVTVLSSAVRGEMLCSPRIAGSLVRRVAVLASERGRSSATARLTRREREIVRLIDAGLSNKQIAVQLSIELATVKNHVHHILEKLDVGRRAEAAAVVRNGRI